MMAFLGFLLSMSFVRQTCRALSVPAVARYQASGRFGVPSTMETKAVEIEAFARGEVPILIMENAVTEADIASWKYDAKTLKSAGFGQAAGVATKHDGIRQGVHQVWLQTIGQTQVEPVFIGDIDARRRLGRLVEQLRFVLNQEKNNILAPNLVELSYLLYDDKGAFYRKHIDSIAGHGRAHGRCVSFLLYLGAGDDVDRPWDSLQDGGSLRVFDPSIPQTAIEVPPTPGMLVIFDSERVPHEVLETKRSRVAIVGWLGRYY